MSCRILLSLTFIVATVQWHIQGVLTSENDYEGICAELTPASSCPLCNEKLEDVLTEKDCQHRSVVEAQVVGTYSGSKCGKLKTIGDRFNNHEMEEFAYFSILSNCSCALIRDGQKVFVIGPPTTWQNDMSRTTANLNKDVIILGSNIKNQRVVAKVVAKCQQKTKRDLPAERDLANDAPYEQIEQDDDDDYSYPKDSQEEISEQEKTLDQTPDSESQKAEAPFQEIEALPVAQAQSETVLPNPKPPVFVPAYRPPPYFLNQAPTPLEYQFPTPPVYLPKVPSLYSAKPPAVYRSPNYPPGPQPYQPPPAHAPYLAPPPAVYQPPAPPVYQAPVAYSAPQPPVYRVPGPTAYQIPEPRAYRHPDPTAYRSPDPAAYRSPDPTAYRSPGPAAYRSPDPAAYRSPDPSAYRSPNLAAYRSPDPAAYRSPDPAAYRSPDPKAYQAPKPPAYRAPDPPAYQAPDPPTYQAPDPPKYLTPDPPAYRAPDPPPYQVPEPPPYQAPDPPTYQKLDPPPYQKPDPPPYQKPDPPTYQKLDPPPYQKLDPPPYQKLDPPPYQKPDPPPYPKPDPPPYQAPDPPPYRVPTPPVLPKYEASTSSNKTPMSPTSQLPADPVPVPSVYQSQPRPVYPVPTPTVYQPPNYQAPPRLVYRSPVMYLPPTYRTEYMSEVDFNKLLEKVPSTVYNSPVVVSQLPVPYHGGSTPVYEAPTPVYQTRFPSPPYNPVIFKETVKLDQKQTPPVYKPPLALQYTPPTVTQHPQVSTKPVHRQAKAYSSPIAYQVPPPAQPDYRKPSSIPPYQIRTPVYQPAIPPVQNQSPLPDIKIQPETPPFSQVQQQPVVPIAPYDSAVFSTSQFKIHQQARPVEQSPSEPPIDYRPKIYDKLTIPVSRTPIYYSPVYSRSVGPLYPSPVYYINRTYELQQKFLIPLHNKPGQVYTQAATPIAYDSAPVKDYKLVNREQKVEKLPYQGHSDFPPFPKQMHTPISVGSVADIEQQLENFLNQAPVAFSRENVHLQKLPQNSMPFPDQQLEVLPEKTPVIAQVQNVPLQSSEPLPVQQSAFPKTSRQSRLPLVFQDRSFPDLQYPSKPSFPHQQINIPVPPVIPPGYRPPSPSPLLPGTDPGYMSDQPAEVDQLSEVDQTLGTETNTAATTKATTPVSEKDRSGQDNKFIQSKQVAEESQKKHVRSKRNDAQIAEKDLGLAENKVEQINKDSDISPEMSADDPYRYDATYVRQPVHTTELENPLFEKALIAPPLPSLKYSHSTYENIVDASVCHNNYECPICVIDLEGPIRDTACDFDYILAVDIQAESHVFSGGDYGVSCNVMDVSSFILGDYQSISGTLAFKRNPVCSCPFAKHLVGPFIIMAEKDSFYPAGGPYSALILDHSVKLVRYSFKNVLALTFTLDQCGKLYPLQVTEPVAHKTYRQAKQFPDLVSVNATPVYETPAPAYPRKSSCPVGSSPSCPKCIKDVYDSSFQNLYCNAAGAYIVNQGLVQIPPDSLAEKQYDPHPQQSISKASRSCYVINFSYIANLKSFSQEQTPMETEGYLETSCSCMSLQYPGSVLLLSLYNAKGSHSKKLYLSKDHVLVNLSPGLVHLPTCQQTAQFPASYPPSQIPSPSLPGPYPPSQVPIPSPPYSPGQVPVPSPSPSPRPYPPGQVPIPSPPGPRPYPPSQKPIPSPPLPRPYPPSQVPSPFLPGPYTPGRVPSPYLPGPYPPPRVPSPYYPGPYSPGRMPSPYYPVPYPPPGQVPSPFLPGPYPAVPYPSVPEPSFPCPSVLQNSCPLCASAVTQDSLETFCEAPYVAVARTSTYGRSKDCQSGSAVLRQEVLRAHGVKGGVVPVGSELQYYLKPDCSCPGLNSGTGYFMIISTRILNQRTSQLTSNQVIISLPYGSVSLPACVAATAQEVVHTYQKTPPLPVAQSNEPAGVYSRPAPPKITPPKHVQQTHANYSARNVYSSPQTRPIYIQQNTTLPKISYERPAPVLQQPYRPVNQTAAPVQQVRFPRYGAQGGTIYSVPYPAGYPLNRDLRSPYRYPASDSSAIYIPPRYHPYNERPPIAIGVCPNPPDTCSKILLNIGNDLKTSICSYPTVLLVDVYSIGALSQMSYVPCGIARLVKAVRGHPSLFAKTIRYSYKTECPYSLLKPGMWVYVLSKTPPTSGTKIENLSLNSETVLLSYNTHVERELMNLLSSCPDHFGNSPENVASCPLKNSGCPVCYSQPPEHYKELFCSSQHAMVVALGLDYNAMKNASTTDIIFKTQAPVKPTVKMSPEKDVFASIYVKENDGLFSSGIMDDCFHEKVRILYNISPHSRTSAYTRDVTSYLPTACNCNFLQSGPGYGVIMSTGKPVLGSISDRVQLSDGYTTFPLPMGTLTLPSCVVTNGETSGSFFRFPRERSLSGSYNPLKPRAPLTDDENDLARFTNCGSRPDPSCPLCYPYFTQAILDDFCSAEYAYIWTAQSAASENSIYTPRLSVVDSLDYTKLTVTGSLLPSVNSIPSSGINRQKRGAEHFCPMGLVYSSCAPPVGCEPTCESPHSVQCYSRICRPGCTCPKGQVRQGSACVHPKQCAPAKYMDRCLQGSVNVAETIKPRSSFSDSKSLSYFIQGYCSCPFLEYPQGSALIFSSHPIRSETQLTDDVRVVILPYGTTSIPECGGTFYVRPPPQANHPEPNILNKQTTVNSKEVSESTTPLMVTRGSSSTTPVFSKIPAAEPTAYYDYNAPEGTGISPTESAVECPMFEGCPSCEPFDPTKMTDIFCGSKQAIIAAVGVTQTARGMEFKYFKEPTSFFTNNDDGTTFVKVQSTDFEYENNAEMSGCFNDQGNVMYDVTSASDPKLLNKSMTFFMSANCSCPSVFGVPGYALVILDQKLGSKAESLHFEGGVTVVPLPYGITIMPECEKPKGWWGPKDVVLPASGPLFSPKEVKTDADAICQPEIPKSCPKCYPYVESKHVDLYCSSYVSLIFPKETGEFSRYGSPQITVAKMTVNKKHRYSFTVGTEGVRKHQLYKSAFPVDAPIEENCPNEAFAIGNYCLNENPFEKTSEGICEEGSISHMRISPKKYKSSKDMGYTIRQECLCPYLESPHGFALLLSEDKQGSEGGPYQLTEADTILSLPFGETLLPHCDLPPADEGDNGEDTPVAHLAGFDAKCPQPSRTCPVYQKNLLEKEDVQQICKSDYVIVVEVLQSPCSKGCGIGQVADVLKGRKSRFEQEILMSIDTVPCPCELTNGSKVYMANFESSWTKGAGKQTFVGLALGTDTRIFAASIEDDINSALDKCT